MISFVKMYSPSWKLEKIKIYFSYVCKKNRVSEIAYKTQTKYLHPLIQVTTCICSFRELPGSSEDAYIYMNILISTDILENNKVKRYICLKAYGYILIYSKLHDIFIFIKR